MPPFLELNGGVASANFTANVEGGKAPLTYAWSMEGAFSLLLGSEQNSITASYSAAGEYTASVTVTDACDYSDTDTLTVVVIDTVIPSCHPTAQRIAEAVNTLFPDQAEQLYTCEDIYNIFLGDLTGSHTGFGRLWHAYKLAATIEELTWEQIRDWQLDGSGWGILVQLDKFADALDEVSIIDLMDKVTSGENTVNQIRTALRNVLRYEADFEDALTRLAEGASPGSLGQFYRVAQELGISPEELDGYLEQGMDISELRHAAKLASQTDTDWMDLALAHSEGYSWGEIKQALHMADEDTDVMDLLGLGVKEVRQQQRDETRNEQADDRDLQTAAKIAEQYGSTESEVMAMYEGDCATDWSCVRKHFREAAENGKIDQDQSTATRLASQHGVDEDEVWSLFEGTCAGDWKCVRTELRNQTRGSRGKGKD
jgi:PKD repeat protein